MSKEGVENTPRQMVRNFLNMSGNDKVRFMEAYLQQSRTVIGMPAEIADAYQLGIDDAKAGILKALDQIKENQ